MSDSPIYQQLSAEHPPDVPALAGLDAPRFDGLDAQSVAYRGMTALDVVADVELPGLAERRHPAYVPGATVPPASVEDYEAIGWDEGRTDPRPVLG